jgi:hypothetical protein
MDEDYLKEVYRRLTQGEYDSKWLVAAYTKTGHMLAEVRAEAEDAAVVRKKGEAEQFLLARKNGATVEMANKLATVASFDLARAEIVADRRKVKLTHLREAVGKALSTMSTITFGDED